MDYFVYTFFLFFLYNPSGPGQAAEESQGGCENTWRPVAKEPDLRGWTYQRKAKHIKFQAIQDGIKEQKKREKLTDDEDR